MAPLMASKVFLIRCSRAWTSTWMVTSSGMWPPSMSSRQISYSVSLAEGKPISISLMPMSTSVWKYSSFSWRFMGSTRGLVAVPQVHGAPGGGLGDHLVGPGAAHDLLGLEGDILFVAWIHGSFLLNESIFTVEGCFRKSLAEFRRRSGERLWNRFRGGFADPKNTSQTASVPEGRAQRAAISSAGKGRQAFFWPEKKRPRPFSSQGRGMLLTRYHPGSAAGHPNGPQSLQQGRGR